MSWIRLRPCENHPCLAKPTCNYSIVVPLLQKLTTGIFLAVGIMIYMTYCVQAVRYVARTKGALVASTESFLNLMHWMVWDGVFRLPIKTRKAVLEAHFDLATLR